MRLTVHDGAGARFIGLMSLTVAEMFLFLGFRMLGKWWKSIPKTFAKWEVRPMRSWERIRTIWRTGVAVWKWVEDFLGGVLVTGAAGYAVVFALGDISSADAALLICGALFFYVGILALSGWWHSLRKTFSN